MKKTVTIPIFEKKLHLLDDMDEAVDLVGRLRTKLQAYQHDSEWEPEDEDLPTYGSVWMPYNEIVMCVADGKPGTVAHEAVHVATHLLSYSGVDAGLQNDEPIAYLVGWVVKQWQEKMDGY